MLLLRLCERLAAAALGAAIVIVTAVAASRYFLAFTPVWTEPVVALLIFFSVCLAMPPGLHDGVHVAMRWLDAAAPGLRSVREFVGWCLSALLGTVLLLSALAYTADMYGLGLEDYAGIPQWFAGAIGALFGFALAAYSAVQIWLGASRSGSEE